MTNDTLIAAEIAATADAMRDADTMILDMTTNSIRFEKTPPPAPVYITCTSYYNEGLCPCCSDKEN